MDVTAPPPATEVALASASTHSVAHSHEPCRSTATRPMPQLMTELHSFAARTPGRHEARPATSRAPQNAQRGHPGNRGPVAPSWVVLERLIRGWPWGQPKARPRRVRSDSTAPDRAEAPQNVQPGHPMIATRAIVPGYPVSPVHDRLPIFSSALRPDSGHRRLLRRQDLAVHRNLGAVRVEG
jgi:hypothetical protein